MEEPQNSMGGVNLYAFFTQSTCVCFEIKKNVPEVKYEIPRRGAG